MENHEDEREKLAAVEIEALRRSCNVSKIRKSKK